ncbi:hypothetical protein BDV23DRAFT_144068 [Aspergillus alliaceus]|uniref:Uncharacterized protein n=1 Tax=Petromyces alliaceus TaxID=209559 RepID=A0A5N7CNV6_PETAA|nr:hypothetical protein BDV23DRAFT_144068 [Aspergillus alliaceus]
MASQPVETIFTKLQQQSTSSASLQLCIQAVQNLSAEEQNALVAFEPAYSLTAADRQAFTRAAIQALSADDVDGTLSDAANGAYDAANNIFELLMSFVLNCICYDNQFGTNYTDEKLTPILVQYIKTMVDSVPFANQVAQYGENFDEEVIAFCANQDLSIDQRLSKIRGYISDAEEFEAKATEIQSTLDKIQEELLDLLNEINNRVKMWAKPRSPSAPRLAVSAAKPPFKLGVAVLDALLSTPLRPLIMIAGLLGLGNPEAVRSAYAIAASEVVRMSAKKPTALTILHELRSVANGDDVNAKYFSDFRDNVSILNTYWSATIVDARSIETWLEDGASWVDFPEYMELNLKQGVRTYVKIAKYLRSYATQIDSLHYDELLEAAGYA